MIWNDHWMINDLKLQNWNKSCSEDPIAYSAHLQLCSAEQANNWHLEIENLAQQACRWLGQRKGWLIWFVGHLKFTWKYLIIWLLHSKCHLYLTVKLLWSRNGGDRQERAGGRAERIVWTANMDAHDANGSDWNFGEPFLYVGTYV